MSTPAWKKRLRQAQHVKEKEKREYEKMFACKPTTKKEFKPYVPPQTFRRNSDDVTSLKTSDTIPAGTTARKEPMRYTGDYIVGIATMHKSNLVPVGREQDPKDFSTMRRN